MDNLKIPRHVGFIMDGNGRWAKKRLLPRSQGHIKGADNVEKVAEYCFERGVEVVSLYAFSTENWSRPKQEVDEILKLLDKFLKKCLKQLTKHEIRLTFSGDLSKLPLSLQELCNQRIEETKEFKKRTLNIAINYGGRQEIIRACNSLLSEGKTCISEEDFIQKLYTKDLPDIDLVIRTSGEQRLSNFFIYQCSYAELYFTDCLWPDFNEKEIDSALKWYSDRDRRFGKV